MKATLRIHNKEAEDMNAEMMNRWSALPLTLDCSTQATWWDTHPLLIRIDISNAKIVLLQQV